MTAVAIWLTQYPRSTACPNAPVEQLQGLNSTRQPVHIGPVSVPLVSRVKTSESRDELQIILHAVLKLFEEHVLIAKLPRKLIALCPRPFGDIDEGHDRISLPGILILDDAGITFHEREFRAVSLESPDEIVGFCKRVTKCKVRLVFQLE
jgi:hypothetical protein